MIKTNKTCLKYDYPKLLLGQRELLGSDHGLLCNLLNYWDVILSNSLWHLSEQ